MAAESRSPEAPSNPRSGAWTSHPFSHHTAERPQERDQRLLLLMAQSERLQFGIQMRVASSTPVVVFDHLFQTANATVMHVRALAAICRSVGVLNAPRSCSRLVARNRPASW